MRLVIVHCGSRNCYLTTRLEDNYNNYDYKIGRTLVYQSNSEIIKIMGFCSRNIDFFLVKCKRARKYVLL